MARLAVARLWFCSNSFAPRRTRADDVWAHEWRAGPNVLASPVPGGELEGVRQFLSTRPGWSVTMLRCASAPASGPLSADLFGTWMAEIENDLCRGRFDAVYLSLHGACQAEGDPAADVTILRRVRSIVGHTPVVASFDMRANLSEETAILLDGSSVNHIWPHGGGDLSAMRALSLLEGTLSGQCRPVGALARVPVLLEDAILPEALAELRQGQMTNLPAGVLEASVFGGFAWGDSPYAGPSALVWADRDAGMARETAAHLAMTLTRWRNRQSRALAPPAMALRGLALDESGERPALLLDVGDDPASGSLSDTPELLRAVLAESAAGRASGRILVMALHDPAAVAQAMMAGPGGEQQWQLGGRSTALYGAGVVVRATAGMVGETMWTGRFALLRAGGVDILVTADHLVDATPDVLAGLGIVLGDYRVLALKGGIVAQAAFSAHVSEVVACDCPGPTSPMLTRLPYHYVPAARRVPSSSPAATASAESAQAAVSQGLGIRGGIPSSGPVTRGLPLTDNLALPAVALPPSLPMLAPRTDISGQCLEERRGKPQVKRPEAFGVHRR